MDSRRYQRSFPAFPFVENFGALTGRICPNVFTRVGLPAVENGPLTSSVRDRLPVVPPDMP